MGVSTHIGETWLLPGTSQVVLLVKNVPADARGLRDLGSIPGLGKSPGQGNGSPLQYSCLDNAMDRGAWWAIVYRVAKSQTQLKLLSTRTHGFLPCPLEGKHETRILTLLGWTDGACWKPFPCVFLHAELLGLRCWFLLIPIHGELFNRIFPFN